MWLRILLVAVVAGAACDLGSPAGESPLSPQAVVEREAAIYQAVMTRGPDAGFRPTFLFDRVCSDAATPGADENCTVMSDELQTHLARLMPDVEFVSRVKSLTDRIFKDRQGGRIVYLGPIRGAGDRVEVPNSYYCGGLCAGGTTTVLEWRGSEWEPVGTKGPTLVS